jgi:DNA invertase Pin-like site-specific DNA recombinase
MMNPTTQNPKGRRQRVIGLIRVSTEEQARGDRAGVTRQQTAIRQGAEYQNLEIVREMVAIDVSGRHVNFDPDFQKLFEDLKRSDIEGVIVAEQSRIFRPEDFSDFAILDHFKRNRKFIWTPSERIDPNTREGRLSLTMHGAMSGDELQRIRERTMGGKEEMRKAGRHPGGKQMLPRGIRYEKTRNADGKVIACKWVLDGIDSERVRQAFQLLFAGYSYASIASKIGGGWTGNGIRESLANPIWKGVRSYCFEAKGEEYLPKGSTKPRHRLTRRATPLEVPIEIEQLIPSEAWERAQEIIEERKTRWRKTKKPARFLCSSLLRCSCGKAMYLRSGSRGHGTDHYYCASRFPRGKGCGAPSIYRSDMDRAVEQLITAHLLNVEFLAKLLDSVHEAEHSGDQLQSKREEALRRIAAKRRTVHDMVLDGTMTREEARQRVDALDRERREIECMFPVQIPAIDARALVTRIVHAFRDFPELPFEAKRELLRRAVREITVSGQTIPTITFSGGFLGAGTDAPASGPSLQPTANLEPQPRAQYWHRYPWAFQRNGLVRPLELPDQDNKGFKQPSRNTVHERYPRSFSRSFQSFAPSGKSWRNVKSARLVGSRTGAIAP